MCNVVDQMLETGRSEGIEIGKNEGRIQGSIETYQEMNVGYDNTQFYIEMKYNLSSEKAAEYMKKFWKKKEVSSVFAGMLAVKTMNQGRKHLRCKRCFLPLLFNNFLMSVILLFAVFAAVDPFYRICQNKYLFQLLLNRGDTSRVFAADYVVDLFRKR